MRKIFASAVILLLAVSIAFVSVGCQKGGNEITFSTDSRPKSSTDVSNTTGSSSGSASTVLYVLTTVAGETIPPVSTTLPTTVPPTMNYDPVTVPSTNNTNTTAAPTTTEKPTTTEPPTTTQPPTSSIKYVSITPIDDTDGAFTKDKICVYVNADLFSGNVKAAKGKLTVNFGPNSYNTNYKVLSELYAGEQIEIDVDVPSNLLKAVEADSSGTSSITVSVPQGAIVTSDNMSNKGFTSFSIFYSPD